MESSLLLILEKAGVDTKGALARFSGASDLYVKFLRRFPSDQTFENIKAAFKKGDWNDTLNAVHTLKGVSANLGMNRLFAASSETVRLIRESNYAAAAESYAELNAAYEEIYSVITGWEDSNR